MKVSDDKQKCLNVALLGRPSSGKSTFINTLLGASVSSVSSTPQTTKKVIRGIYTEERGQLVFLDTPGISSFNKFSKEISRLSLKTIKNSEAVLFMVDAFDDEKSEADFLTSLLRDVKVPVFTLINKCDSASKECIEKRKNYIKEHLPTSKIFEISALVDSGIDEVLIELFKIAQYRYPEFDANIFTDESLDDRVSEVIRESAIVLLKRELPHVISVKTEDIEDKGNKVWIRASLFVQKDSQKKIVIGKNGDMISLIRKNSVKKLKEIFPTFDYLELHITIKVKEN